MSLFSRLMPGAFQSDSSNQEPAEDFRFSGDAMEVVDKDNLDEFINRQKVYKKTQRQAHMISQLDTLVYVLVWYQLIKYCHSACVIPVIGHILVQKLLCCERFNNRSTDTRDFLTFLNEMDHSDMVTEEQRRASIDNVANKVCSAVYWKGFGSILYHIGFVCFWLIPIAEGGRLKLITNGSWWFVSFIGEPISVDNIQEISYMAKLVELGLLGLVISDLCILFIQLMLLQAIYRQSIVSPIGRKLQESEIEVLRVGNSIGNGDQIVEPTFEPPLAIVIKLYEVFNSSTFIPTRDY